MQELIAYGDPVRSLARPSEEHLLTLVARKVRTAGGTYPNSLAAGLTYIGLRTWMNGSTTADFRGAFERWQISQDGEPDGPIYHYRTHRARHDRQTVLLQHGAPPVARLRDLTTRSRDAHLVYGHAWDELTNELFDQATSDPKATLIDKATRGVLIGEGVRVSPPRSTSPIPTASLLVIRRS